MIKHKKQLFTPLNVHFHISYTFMTSAGAQIHSKNWLLIFRGQVFIGGTKTHGRALKRMDAN